MVQATFSLVPPYIFVGSLSKCKASVKVLSQLITVCDIAGRLLHPLIKSLAWSMAHRRQLCGLISLCTYSSHFFTVYFCVSTVFTINQQHKIIVEQINLHISSTLLATQLCISHNNTFTLISGPLSSCTKLSQCLLRRFCHALLPEHKNNPMPHSVYSLHLFR